MTVRYVPTATDKVWLLRAVEAEGEPRQDVASAMVNRYLYLLSKGTRAYPTLAEFVRAYSAPVNPRRMRGGDIWQKLYRQGDAAQRASLEAAHKRRTAHSAREVFSASTMDAVTRALTEGSSRPTVTDFAAHTFEPSPGLELVQRGRPGVNALYTAAPKWRGYEVTSERELMPVLDSEGRSKLGLVAVVVLVAWGLSQLGDA